MVTPVLKKQYLTQGQRSAGTDKFVAIWQSVVFSRPILSTQRFTLDATDRRKALGKSRRLDLPAGRKSLAGTGFTVDGIQRTFR